MTTTTPPTGETNGQATGFEPIESQEALDKIIQTRVARERSKYADYDEIKERLEAAEQRTAELEAKATRAEVAATKGVPVALLTGSTQEELEASANALIAFKGQPSGLVVPREGTPLNPSRDDPMRELAGNLFGNPDYL